MILARRAIQQADVAVLVIDATLGAADQDGAIAGEAEKAGCGIVIAANKWDLVKDRGADYYKTFDDELRRQLKFLDYAPILHISAATGERATKVLETVDQVADARSSRVPTGELNRFVKQITAEHPPIEPGAPRRPRDVRRANVGRTADVRVLHERRNRVPFLISAISGQSAARRVQAVGHTDPAARPQAREEASNA